MTPTQVYNQTRNQVYEIEAAFYTESELYSYILEGELILTKKVKCSQATDSSITTVASTREYSVPSGVIEITRLTWNQVKLKKIDLTDLDLLEGTQYGGSTVTGNPVYYYQFGGVIGFSPIPDTAQTVKLYYVKEPTALTSSSTTFTMPDDFGQYLIDYCLYRMYLKDDQTNKANTHLGLWESNLAKAQREWDDRNLNDEYAVVKDEDQYPSTQLGII